MAHKLSLSELSVKGKKVLLRVDFNVPLNKEGDITDDTRITAALPTIKYILDHGGALILMSHLGRPKGKVIPEFSLEPCAERLFELLDIPVSLATDCIGNETKRLASNLKMGEILLLENLRFHKAEEHPDEDPNFTKQLAALGDVYVNDAFGTAHRKHASTYMLPMEFPGKAAMGFLFEKEVEFLGQALNTPKHPFYAIIGGAKISTKIGVIKSLLNKTDSLLIGGGMAYTFFKAKGLPIGESICEEDMLGTAREILHEVEKSPNKLLLPVDIMVVDNVENNRPGQVIPFDKGIPDGEYGVDIGPETIKLFKHTLQDAKTIFWNGPMGIFEMSHFAKGTNELAKTLADSKAVTIVGGGDSIAALNQLGLAQKITHISTGGGASLKFVEQGTLPCLDILSDSTAKV